MVAAKYHVDHRQAFDYARLSFSGTFQNELTRRIQRKTGCSHYAIFYKAAVPVSLPKVYLADNLDFSCRVLYDQRKMWMTDPVLEMNNDEDIRHWEQGARHFSPGIATLIKSPAGNRYAEASTLVYPMRNGSVTLMTLIWAGGQRPDIDFNEMYEVLFAESRLVTQNIYKILKCDPSVVGSQLNVREVQIMRLLAGGLTSKQVADAISVTRATVYFHVKQFTRKMNASTRSEAIIKAALLRVI
ncbi:helix-turn-helix domain-containing protein [Pseudomonas fontis]|uniref:Helix-turn-helix transcriptional regulator n=1 Tax=Pseudomonas fontis TaxID=2942633 RepID=A0ABT5NYL3_9PSED|nr:helix-turn-helix transcriptional regulator [Pseudomonas fontis]MDD0976784.1 helix-turn-helix transcriptional regulator [Pseudomonas fontis]MDD0993217.1 helix-turn-helix transcriptional regulator [Pseudomonas fontis]